jgi:hypothetical protein
LIISLTPNEQQTGGLISKNIQFLRAETLISLVSKYQGVIRRLYTYMWYLRWFPGGFQFLMGARYCILSNTRNEDAFSSFTRNHAPRQIHTSLMCIP